MAIVFGCQKFHCYIYGLKATVQSDHKPLETLFKKQTSVLPARLQAMQSQLQMYDLKVEYVPGSRMLLADILSRDVANSKNVHFDFDSDVHVLTVSMADSQKEELLKAYNCEEMLLLRKYIADGFPHKMKLVEDSVKPYWNVRDELSYDAEFIYKGPTRIVIPPTAQVLILADLHKGHLGIQKTIALALDTVYWPNICKDITEFVSNCPVCQENARSNQTEPIYRQPAATLPWQKVAVDIAKSAGHYYLITADDYSGWVECDLLLGMKPWQIIAALKKQFSRHGIPLIVQSDNGTQFTSSEFQQFAKVWRFQHHTISTYHSRSNGLVERNVGTVKRLLEKSYTDGSDFNLAMLQFRNARRSADIPSPAERLYSRKLRSILPISEKALKPKVPKDVSRKLDIARSESAKYANKHAKELPELQVGQYVYMQNGKKWQLGKIVEKANKPRSYWVKIGSKEYRRNRSFLRPAKSHTGEFEIKQQEVNLLPPMMPQVAQKEKRNDAQVEDANNGNETAAEPAQAASTPTLISTLQPPQAVPKTPETAKQPAAAKPTTKPNLQAKSKAPAPGLFDRKGILKHEVKSKVSSRTIKPVQRF